MRMLIRKILSYTFPKTLWHYYSNVPKIYLTFDDGVHLDTTPPLLEILDKYEAKATFFCIGKNVDRYPSLFEQIIAAGHSVGNHTYSHLNGFKTSTKEYVDDVKLASEYIPGNLFRPPYGRITPWQYNALKKNYRIVFWSRLSWDFKYSVTPEKCFSMVKATKPGEIVVFHDSLKAFPKMKYALPKLLETMKKKEIEFATLK